MSVIEAYGFEGRAAAVDGMGINITFTGSAAYSTAQHRTGAASIRINPASGASGYAQGSSNALFQHFGLYIASLPTIERSIFGGETIAHLGLKSDGTLTIYNGSNVLIGTSQALSTGQWYWIGIDWSSHTGPCLQIDGVTAVSGTQNQNGPTTLWGCHGTEASAIDIYIDDLIGDNAAFLAPSNVDFALPISDNTVTGVTDNNGVATNIWQCVSNIPPAGVASANEAANPKKGMHFPASTTCDYIANLETYTTLGVASGDTIIAVQSVLRHGEDIATGTKNGVFKWGTNCGDAGFAPGGLSFAFGNDGGAHSAETGLWVTAASSVVTTGLGTIVLGTSPTIEVTRVSQSRLGCADFMALLVVWTPAPAAANPPYFRPYPQLLAQ